MKSDGVLGSKSRAPSPFLHPDLHPTSPCGPLGITHLILKQHHYPLVTTDTFGIPTTNKVLVTGGWTDIATAELYDPLTNTWSSAGSMSTTRAYHIAALVNGKVLVSGGHTNSNRAARQTADLYDPTTNSWTPTASMVSARTWHGVAVLLSGKVLITNGAGGAGSGRSIEIYTPAASPPGSPVGNNIAQGNTCSATDVFTPTCAYSYSPEGSFIWTAPYSGTFTFTTTGSDFDTILEILDDNTSNSIDCNDDANSTSQSALTVTLAAGQSVKVMIDGYSWSCGNYTLNVQ
jgi:hypothetical protein